MKTFRNVVGAVMVLALAGCGIDAMEDTFKWRMQSLDELIAKASEPMASDLKKQKAAFEAEYAALPKEEGPRGEGLGKLNQRSRAVIDEATKALEGAAAAEAAKEEAALAEYQKGFVGVWQGTGMSLTITADGGVQYERATGSGNKSVNAPIQKFTRDAFEVGVMGITTTFTIDRPPQQVDGVWKMTIDGVELTRTQP